MFRARVRGRPSTETTFSDVGAMGRGRFECSGGEATAATRFDAVCPTASTLGRTEVPGCKAVGELAATNDVEAAAGSTGESKKKWRTITTISTRQRTHKIAVFLLSAANASLNLTRMPAVESAMTIRKPSPSKRHERPQSRYCHPVGW